MKKSGDRMDGHQLQGSSSRDAAAKELAGGDGLMKETFGTKALGIMRSHKEAYDMVLISDFGYTQADHAHAAHVHVLTTLAVQNNAHPSCAYLRRCTHLRRRTWRCRRCC